MRFPFLSKPQMAFAVVIYASIERPSREVKRHLRPHTNFVAEGGGGRFFAVPIDNAAANK